MFIIQIRIIREIEDYDYGIDDFLNVINMSLHFIGAPLREREKLRH